AAGDRAAAVQHARVHAALLREELEVEPDPLVQALAAELAAAPTPTPESRPSTPARPAGPAAADAGALDMPGAATPPPSAPHLAEAVAIASAGAQPENPSASAAKRQPQPAQASPPRSRLRYLRRQGLALAPLLVILLITATVVWESGRRAWHSPEPATGSAETIAIAVMPFDYQGSPESAYLGDGLVTLIGTSLNEAGRLRATDSYSILSQTAE